MVGAFLLFMVRRGTIDREYCPHIAELKTS